VSDAVVGRWSRSTFAGVGFQFPLWRHRRFVGLSLVVVLAACGSPTGGSREPVSLAGVAYSSDGQSLTIGVNSCNGNPSATVTEQDTTVLVAAEAFIPAGDDQETCEDKVSIVLDEPLGSRRLVDAVGDRTIEVEFTSSEGALSLTHVAAEPGPVEDLPLGSPGCDPPSPLAQELGGAGPPETRGTVVGDGELFGLVLPEHGLPLRATDRIKIVWRMTGSGPLVATATSPSGTPTPLDWGPDEHGGSNYDRPGDEWGAGYRFDEYGCWHLHLARDDTQADVWLDIAPAR
jgi:hypothetical protein